jgi:D-arabinose 1-dehydrogenase-like Zn-dependent alcohol dehydrogenase
MADLIKMASEYGSRVVIEADRLAEANEVLHKLKNSEIDARTVLMP